MIRSWRPVRTRLDFIARKAPLDYPFRDASGEETSTFRPATLPLSLAQKKSSWGSPCPFFEARERGCVAFSRRFRSFQEKLGYGGGGGGRALRGSFYKSTRDLQADRLCPAGPSLHVRRIEIRATRLRNYYEEKFCSQAKGWLL